MEAMAFQDQACTRESVLRKPRTSEDWREVVVFLAQSLGLVGAAVLLHTLGPVFGITLIAGSLLVWSLHRNRPASV
jgi:hypothetical protein